MDSTKKQQIQALNLQLTALYATAVGLGMVIYATNGYKDLVINETNSTYKKEELDNIVIYSSAIYLIVAIYFFITTIDQYDNSKTSSNFNFLEASTLVMIATFIRFTTLSKNPISFQGAEDVIG